MIQRRRQFVGGALGMFSIVPLAVLTGCQTMSLADRIAAILKEALALLAGKRYDEALAKFTEVVRLDNRNVAAYVGMARSFIGKGDWGGAIKSARDAFQIAPAGQDVVAVFAESLFGGGVDALKGGRFSDAIGHLTEYLKLQPNNPSAYLDLGRAFLGNRQFGSALEALVKGLGLAGQGSAGPSREEFVRSLFEGGTQALQQNSFRDAAGFFSEVVKSDRTNLQAYLNLGRAYWNAGDRGQALGAFGEVLKLNPGNGEALRFMLQGR